MEGRHLKSHSIWPNLYATIGTKDLGYETYKKRQEKSRTRKSTRYEQTKT